MLRVFHHVCLHLILEALYEHLHQEHVHQMCQSGHCYGGLSRYNLIFWDFVWSITSLFMASRYSFSSRFFSFSKLFNLRKYLLVSGTSRSSISCLSFLLKHPQFGYIEKVNQSLKKIEGKEFLRLFLQSLHIPRLLLHPLL